MNHPDSREVLYFIGIGFDQRKWGLAKAPYTASRFRRIKSPGGEVDAPASSDVVHPDEVHTPFVRKARRPSNCS